MHNAFRTSGFLLRTRRGRILSLPLLDTICNKVCRLQQRHPETVRGDQQEYARRMLASGVLHDQQGEWYLFMSSTFANTPNSKFWNVKVNVRRPNSLQPSTESVDQQPLENSYVEEEQKETAISLKDKQLRMEQQVYRIWTYVLRLVKYYHR